MKRTRLRGHLLDLVSDVRYLRSCDPVQITADVIAALKEHG